jgi:hypothetical protein
MIGKDHPVPAIAKSEFSVVCDFPSEITLIANENGTFLSFPLIFSLALNYNIYIMKAFYCSSPF